MASSLPSNNSCKPPPRHLIWAIFLSKLFVPSLHSSFQEKTFQTFCFLSTTESPTALIWTRACPLPSLAPDNPSHIQVLLQSRPMRQSVIRNEDPVLRSKPNIFTVWSLREPCMLLAFTVESKREVFYMLGSIQWPELVLHNSCAQALAPHASECSSAQIWSFLQGSMK